MSLHTGFQPHTCVDLGKLQEFLNLNEAHVSRHSLTIHYLLGWPHGGFVAIICPDCLPCLDMAVSIQYILLTIHMSSHFRLANTCEIKPTMNLFTNCNNTSKTWSNLVLYDESKADWCWRSTLQTARLKRNQKSQDMMLDDIFLHMFIQYSDTKWYHEFDWKSYHLFTT